MIAIIVLSCFLAVAIGLSVILWRDSEGVDRQNLALECMLSDVKRANAELLLEIAELQAENRKRFARLSREHAKREAKKEATNANP